MADYLVELSLKALLIEKIYSVDTRLMRNDSKAAKLVHNYVESIVNQIELDQDTDFMTIEMANEVWFRIQPLYGLTRDTIRKYIAELWSDNAGYKFVGNCVKLELKDHEKFDIRSLL